MKHAEALVIAEWLVEELKLGCERIEIAGSLRRGKADVHDMEIVAIPKTTTHLDLFGDAVSKESELDKRLRPLEEIAALKKIKGGEKFKQFEIGRWEEFGLQPPAAPFKLDLFLVTPPAQWGVQMVIRTGPADFSQWMVTRKSQGGALPDLYKVSNGCVWRRLTANMLTDPIVMPEEMDFFSFCGLEWIEPGQRSARWRR